MIKYNIATLVTCDNNIQTSYHEKNFWKLEKRFVAQKFLFVDCTFTFLLPTDSVSVFAETPRNHTPTFS